MKRGNGLPSMKDMMNKKAKMDARAAATRATSAPSHQSNNPFLKRPVDLKKAVYIFLQQARNDGRALAQSRGESFPLTKPLVEIEARIGTLKSPFGLHDMRILSSGPKTVSTGGGGSAVVNSFLVNDSSTAGSPTSAPFQGGITRSHFTTWTMAGFSEPSPLSHAFGMKGTAEQLKAQLKGGMMREVESVETVYGGYPNDQRLCYPGEHPGLNNNNNMVGKMEQKKRLPAHIDVALPSAPYDLRMTLATETITDANVPHTPPRGYTTRRLKRRRSYTSKKFAWQVDVTEVAVNSNNTSSGTAGEADPTSYEVEIELLPSHTMKLMNETGERQIVDLFKTYAEQLCFMMGQINPLSDVLEVDTYITDHTDHAAVKLALAHCGSLKRFMDSNQSTWQPAIAASPSQQQQTPKSNELKFIGCMPVNFSRHNIEEVQRAEGGYYLSEKTDGVRYLMVFTGKSVVLVDRAMKGNQPKATAANSATSDPFAHIIPLVQPGTVLDGEVVIHRKRSRPIFIVFDVLCCGQKPVLHLPFEERLGHLKRASFRTPTAQKDMFANTAEDVASVQIPLPLVRKNFVRRTELDRLLKNVIEERGTRTYISGDLHHHLTDGIIFQPNLPYSVGTDLHLLKWKYLDTVTIDVEILPPRGNDDEGDVLRLGVLGDEGTRVDMTRYIRLPVSERLRLEADRAETGAKIAEVGFDPETGEWYYLTMRPDKIASNHISTVLGTLLELAESLDTTELRYRMSVKSSGRDTYRKDVRGMMKQLLDHQRRANGGGR